MGHVSGNGNLIVEKTNTIVCWFDPSHAPNEGYSSVTVYHGKEREYILIVPICLNGFF